MNPAQKIISRFGGQSALAGLLGRRQSTIQHWAKTGMIPAKWHRQLLDAAMQAGVRLSADDFISGINDVGVDTEHVPRATHWGELKIGLTALPCYVLDNGERVFSLKGVVVGLTGVEGGALAEYIKVKTVRPYLPPDLQPQEDDVIPALRRFDTGGEGFTKYAQGITVERFMDICAAYSEAADAPDNVLTPKQAATAVTARAYLRATAKVGIVALVDEATGYQYDREEDALQFKLQLFLSEEMRPWEKTFPDELWQEFGRLTGWVGAAHKRPKYWGKLVMELVYGYLDRDVAEWLKNNAPKPRGGKSYHQWLSSQYGLRKLLEHIWMLIGMARSCNTMMELRQVMAEQFGRHPVQLIMFLPRRSAPVGNDPDIAEKRTEPIDI
jgi:P63C domain